MALKAKEETAAVALRAAIDNLEDQTLEGREEFHSWKTWRTTPRVRQGKGSPDSEKQGCFGWLTLGFEMWPPFGGLGAADFQPARRRKQHTSHRSRSLAGAGSAGSVSTWRTPS